MKARYDRNDPAVACLVDGWRADGMPLLAMFFFGILMLVVFPLPILLGHLVASCLPTG